MKFESDRKTTGIRCFDDRDLFVKNENIQYCKVLKKTKGDNDADTTESAKEKMQKHCYAELLKAVKGLSKGKVRDCFLKAVEDKEGFGDFSDTKSVKSRVLEKDKEFGFGNDDDKSVNSRVLINEKRKGKLYEY